MKRLVILALLVLSGTALYAQTAYDTTQTAQTGEKPLGAYFATDIDSVSLTNGQLHVSLPVFTLPGRELPVKLALDYNSRFIEKRYFYDPYHYWDPYTDTCNEPGQGEDCGGYIISWSPSVWKFNTGFGSKLNATLTLTNTCGPPWQCTYPKWYRLDVYWIEPNGAKHKFTAENLQYNGPCEECDPPVQGGYGPTQDVVTNNLTLSSTESDGIRIYTGNYFWDPAGTAYLYLKNGTSITFEKNYTGGSPAVARQTITTLNGNKLIVADNSNYGYLSSSDTLGHSISFSGTPFTWTDSNGNSQTYSWPSTLHSVASNDANGTPKVPETPLGPSAAYTGFSMWLYDSLVLPNGKSYNLTYDSNTALLTKITFPSGGYIRYTWTRAFSGHTAGPWQIASRIVSADGTSGSEKTWTYYFYYSEWYGASPLGSPWPSLTQGVISSSTVVDPTGGKVMHYFTNGLETKTEYRAADDTILRTVYQAWDNTSSNPRISSTRVQTDFETTSNYTSYSYGDYNNVTGEAYYDFNSSYIGGVSRTFSNIGGNLGAVTNETRYDSSSNVASKTDYVYDEYSVTARSSVPGHTGNTGYTGRSNVTTIKRYKDANNYVAEHMHYDSVGNVVEKDDPLGHATLISYTDKYSDNVNRNSFAFPTRVTDPSGVYVDTTYDYKTGVVKQATDSAGRTTTMVYDVMNRQTSITYPNGGWTHHTFDDTANSTSSPNTPKVTKEVRVDSSNNVGRVIAYFDGLYREWKKETADPGGNMFVETQYDSKGRKWKTSNPYRSGDTVVWTQTAYDALDRPTTVTAPDSSTVQYAYATNKSTVIDEAGNARRYTYDVRGLLTKVEEPSPTLATPAITTYTYNGLGRMTGSNQGSQTRTWAFDWLGRTTSQTLPESGQTTYTYNDDGLLLTKTDARGVTVTMTYGTASGGSHFHDAQTRSFSDSTPTVTLAYNTKGLRSSMTDGLGSVSYTYDSNTDKLTQESRTLTGISGTFSTSYSYDIKGNLTSMTYPSGRIVNFNYATGGGCCNSRLSSVADQTTSTTLNSSLTFNPAGEITANTLGNGVTQSYSYNNRLQQTAITASLSGTSLMNFGYDYGTNSTNTGRVLTRTDNIQQEHSAKYAYDSIYRLQEVGSNDGSWGIRWTFDVWGNRTAQTPSGLATSKAGSQSTGYTNNRITGNSYDSAGNQTNDGNHSYTFNAENQIMSMDAGTVTYAYDGEGRRMKKVTSSESTYYFYGVGGLLCEFSTSTTISSANTASSTDKVLYHTTDKLGSAVLVMNSSGMVIENNRTLPYGEGWLAESTPSTNDKKFTTYQRDQESGLDYAMNRYYGGASGRFVSVDEGKMLLHVPTSLNRYVYTLDDPLNTIDPTGAFPQSVRFPCPVGVGEKREITECEVFVIDIEGLRAKPERTKRSSFGPDVTKEYSLTTACNLDAEGLMKVVTQSFAQFANIGPTQATLAVNGVSSFVSVTFLNNTGTAPGQVFQGASLQILHQASIGFGPSLGVQVQSFTTSVTAVGVTPTSFTFTTNNLSAVFYPAAITFNASNAGNGQITFSISVNANFSGFASEAAFKVGGSALENSVWNHMLENVQKECEKKQ